MRCRSTRTVPIPDTRRAALPPRLDGSRDLGGELRVVQELVDQRGENFLSGYAGDADAVGGFALPDVEGPVLGE